MDKTEISPRQFLIETYKENETKKTQKRYNNNNYEKKPESSLGFHYNKNHQTVNKFLTSRDAFSDKLITKEGCKSYLRDLRTKQENEKNYVISLANGIQGENKHKFAFYLQQYDKEILKPNSQKITKKKEAFVEQVNAISKPNQKLVDRMLDKLSKQESETKQKLSMKNKGEKGQATTGKDW